jgi:G3E family GTPase
MNKIPIVLLNGTLGSGKTTLVNRMLNSAEFKGSFLIENEFASVNIDRQSLAEDHDDEMYEISGSCICCSTGEELEEALSAITAKHWTKPVILEATGMANSAILMRRLFLNQAFMQNFHIWACVLVIDAAETSAQSLTKEQVLEAKLSDVIIVNKSDLAPDTAKDLIVELKRINPDATILSATQADIDVSILAGHESRSEVAFAQIFHELGGIQLETSTYAVLDLDGPLDPDHVKAALRPSSFRPGVNLKRAKGFFVDQHGTYWHVEATAKHIELHKLTKPKQQVLVAIGEGITKEAVKEALA